MENDAGSAFSRKAGRPKSGQVKIRKYFYLTTEEAEALQSIAKVKLLSTSAIVRQFLVERLYTK